MTLPAPEKPVFRIHTTPKKVINDIFVLYTGCNISLSIWAQELETKLMYGTQKAFDEQDAVAKICNDYGINVRPSVSQVLRGTKLTIEVTLCSI